MDDKLSQEHVKKHKKKKSKKKKKHKRAESEQSDVISNLSRILNDKVVANSESEEDKIDAELTNFAKFISKKHSMSDSITSGDEEKTHFSPVCSPNLSVISFKDKVNNNQLNFNPPSYSNDDSLSVGNTKDLAVKSHSSVNELNIKSSLPQQSVSNSISTLPSHRLCPSEFVSQSSCSGPWLKDVDDCELILISAPLDMNIEELNGLEVTDALLQRLSEQPLPNSELKIKARNLSKKDRLPVAVSVKNKDFFKIAGCIKREISVDSSYDLNSATTQNFKQSKTFPQIPEGLKIRNFPFGSKLKPGREKITKCGSTEKTSTPLPSMTKHKKPESPVNISCIFKTTDLDFPQDSLSCSQVSSTGDFSSLAGLTQVASAKLLNSEKSRETIDTKKTILSNPNGEIHLSKKHKKRKKHKLDESEEIIKDDVESDCLKTHLNFKKKKHKKHKHEYEQFADGIEEDLNITSLKKRKHSLNSEITKANVFDDNCFSNSDSPPRKKRKKKHKSHACDE